MSQLAYIAVFLGATVLAVPLSRKLGLGSVLGYLAAGIALGPWGLRIIKDGEEVLHIAEFGVVLLLFVIGLELQPSRLSAMRKAVFGLGLVQVLVTAVLFTLLGYCLGLSPGTALVVGFALSLSSTPLALQLLAERKQLNTQHGRSSFAILLFQDIAVMPMLALLPLLGARGHASLLETVTGAAKAMVVLALLLFGGRFVLRPLLRMVAKTQVKEAFTAVTLLVVIGTALLVDSVGLSMALGAFVAGLLLADSEYRHELEADIEPFKGLLLSLFFISVGMTANIGLLASQPLQIAALVLGLLVVKFIVLWILGRATGHSTESSRGLAFALPQAGEFGFVLFAMAVSYGVMQQSLADTLVIVVTLSMIASPLLMMLQSAIESRLKPHNKKREFDRPEQQGSRVIIAGFGRFGQIVGRVLRMRKIRFTALESSVSQVDFVRRFGNHVYYGDASRLELLTAAGLERAEIFVLAIDDIDTSVRCAKLVRAHFPHVKVLARARNRQHAQRLMDLEVRYIVRETYLSSLDLARHTLEGLGMSRAEAKLSIQRFDEHDQKTLQLQRGLRDDEQKLIQSAQQAARELEQLFEADTRSDPLADGLADDLASDPGGGKSGTTGV